MQTMILSAPTAPRRRLRPPCILAALFLLLALPAAAARDTIEIAGTVEPLAAYRDEWRDLILTVRGEEAVSLRDLRLEGLPGEAVLARRPFDPLPLETEEVEGRTIQVRRYRARIRPRVPGTVQLRPTLHATLISRQRTGWFRSWNEQRIAHRLPVIRLEVHALPETGRPDGFGGAVGHFVLEGQVDPPQPVVGDLVTLRLELRGAGWLGAAHLEPGLPPEGLQAYPLRELHRDPQSGIRAEQVFVVGTTNVTHIPGARLWYFDPPAHAYREARFGPVPIRARLPDAGAMDPRVEPIALPPPEVPLDPVWRPLTPAGLSGLLGRLRALLAGLFLATALGALGHHPRLRSVLPRARTLFLLAGCLAGLLLGLHLDTQARRRHIRLTAVTPLRLGPSDRARIIGHLQPGDPAHLLDESEDWARILTRDRVGWIHARPHTTDTDP